MDYLAIWQHFQSSSQRGLGKLWHSAWTPGAVLAGSTTLVLIYITVTVIYNLYLHPLSGFPGPFWARSSLLWRIYHSMGGRFHRAIDRQHKKYGHVVRVSPNELSFASVESWKAIYGHQVSGKPVPIKSQFYEIYGAGFTSLCIGSERDPKKHGRMRKLLSAAFATKSLVEQEVIVAQAIDLFIDQLGRKGGPETSGLDLTKWYEMAAFDILGEMAFGESFNCIKSGEPHFWSELVLDHLYFITLIDNLRRIPLLVRITRLLFLQISQSVIGTRNTAEARRLSKPTARKDFLTTMVKHFEDGNLEKEELTAHVSTLVIAGGETIATFLGAVTYNLLQSQVCHEKLKNEIRGHFAKSEDINATEARKLPYLQAVIDEGLRIYPPGSQGFPRVSTGMLIGSTWVPPGAEIYTSAWTVTHSEEYFSEPMKFKPDRWLDQGSTDVKEASQPFSLGPRGCLGQNFAMMEINLILAKMFWRYDLELLDPNLDWEGQSHMHVMWWKPELPVRFLKGKRRVVSLDDFHRFPTQTVSTGGKPGP